MLLHSIIGINDSLTRHPDKLNKEELQEWHQSSLESFQNIQKWMGDNYVQEMQREGCRTGVVDLAIGKYEKPPPLRPEIVEVYHVYLRDEIFVQLVKQLTENPCKAHRSMVQGWQLMLLLCRHAQPSEDLMEFIKYMMNKTVAGAKTGDQDTRENSRIAQRCLNALKNPIRVAKTQAFSKLDESGSKYQMVVVLIDGTEVKLEVSGSSQLKDVGAQLGKELGVLCPVSVGNTFDFSFFQLRDGALAPRLLYDDLVVSDIAERWDELREGTSLVSRIGWRRRFLKRDEDLSGEDLAHAALTYRQAVCDFLHETVSGGDHDDLICEIGAAILCTEFNPSNAAAASLILQDDVMIEKLLPMHLFIGMTSEDLDCWRTKILSAEARMRLQMRRESSNVLTRLRVTFGLIRQTALFGAYSWPALQLGGNAVPQKLAAVDEPPSKYMVFNPKDPDSHIWVFVDRRGLHLWPAEGIHGNVLPRTFTFRPEKDVDRLVAWGARRAFIQFVVELHEDAAKAAKGEDIRHLITLKCAQALDIVYTIYAALVEPKAKK